MQNFLCHYQSDPWPTSDAMNKLVPVVATFRAELADATITRAENATKCAPKKRVHVTHQVPIASRARGGHARHSNLHHRRPPPRMSPRRPLRDVHHNHVFVERASITSSITNSTTPHAS